LAKVGNYAEYIDILDLTATEDAYLRRDGVYVVPIGCLRN